MLVIKKIEDFGTDTLFIVGHSSGCAFANELNSRLTGDRSHITLVDLDGFANRYLFHAGTTLSFQYR